jgi:predicted dehydrogenase
MSGRTRREFTRDLALLGAAASLRPRSVFGSAALRVRVAVMGVRSRGLHLAREFAKQPDTEVAWICDVDRRYAETAAAEVEPLQARAPRLEKDVRRVLDQADVDALVVAAPDHWHAPAAILAASAGKHVYLEKPCSHNPAEGEMLIEAQTRHKRIIHMGNQRRSWRNVNRCIEALHGGVIGNVYFARGWYANNRESIGTGRPAPVPEYLDYDLWQGPAPRTPYRDNIHPYNWHWFRRWGTGEALNNGSHEIDLMRWGMGVDYPTRVTAVGGRYAFQDDWEFPDTMVATFEFGKERCFSWEGRSCNNHPVEGDGRGVIFYGEKGSVVVLGDGYVVYANDPEHTVIERVEPEPTSVADATNTMSPDAGLDAVHIANFLAAVRGDGTTSSPIAEGHKSVLLGQLANIAWQTGRVLELDPSNGQILDDVQARALWGREYEPGWEPAV